MSLHSNTEPGLYSLVKNITVNHISSRGWLLTVNTVTSNRYMGLLVGDNLGLRGLGVMYGVVGQWLRPWNFSK